jgi:formate hydrogenlyase transcriptional activator
MIEERQLRSDLYYRLNVFLIRVPPLRERPEDILLLVRYFSRKYAHRMEKRIENIPAAAMRKLTRWHWPGNVRELQNLVERAVILTRSSTLAISVPELSNGGANLALARAGNSDEQDRIVRILKETRGRVRGRSSLLKAKRWYLSHPTASVNRARTLSPSAAIVLSVRTS